MDRRPQAAGIAGPGLARLLQLRYVRLGLYSEKLWFAESHVEADPAA